jgi:UDP-2-acetamido-3-amino-2,3-dideoxy-glucuronate N-acetyltransferase
MIHETAIIDSDVTIGSDTKIWHFCHISSQAKIGNHSSLGQNVYVGEGVQIGNGVKIQNNVSVYTGVTLEDDVFCGPSAVFTNDLNPRAAFPKNKQYRHTHVGQGATIGANATILPGITIGPYAFIGAGSVVTKDVPPYGLVYGNPARLHGYMTPDGTRIDTPPTK